MEATTSVTPAVRKELSQVEVPPRWMTDEELPRNSQTPWIVPSPTHHKSWMGSRKIPCGRTTWGGRGSFLLPTRFGGER